MSHHTSLFPARLNHDEVEHRRAANRALAYLAHGQPLYIACYVALIIFFSFFYTSIVFNPAEKADYFNGIPSVQNAVG